MPLLAYTYDIFKGGFMELLDKLGEAIDKNKIRPRVEVYLYDDKGRVLASRGQEGHSNNVSTSWKFPGGGIESDAGINETARREALEEAGFTTSGRMHAIDSRPKLTKWPDFFRKDMKKQKGRDFHAQYTYFRAAPIGKKDDSELGADKDTLKGMEMVPINTLIKDLESSINNPDNKYHTFDRERLKGLKALNSRLESLGVVKKSSAGLPIMYPEAVNSNKTIEELKDVIDYMQNSKIPRELCLMADKDIGLLFRAFLKDHNKYDCHDEIEQCINITSPVLLRLKEFYNRPRPHEAAKQLGMLITPIASTAALYSDYSGHEDDKRYTGSYPGGHAMQSRFIAKMLSLKYPQLETQLLEIADLIADTRLALGVHFKSDNDYGKLLAESLFDLIK
jgi:8-oxo-dGTP pyrophosphatase MutT (NUDIX family)